LTKLPFLFALVPISLVPQTFISKGLVLAFALGLEIVIVRTITIGVSKACLEGYWLMG
jgi:hypothetical protein